jgi:hypothetical protein
MSEWFHKGKKLVLQPREGLISSEIENKQLGRICESEKRKEQVDRENWVPKTFITYALF